MTMSIDAVMRWRLFALYRCFALFLVCVQGVNTGIHENGTHDSLSKNEKSNKENLSQRPIIKTYFERIDPKRRFTGMTDQDDDALLKFWKKTWYAAGWDPQVISLENAKKHPEYASLVAELDIIHLDAFSRILLIRWLAMAGSGGGWMADYDVFPIRDFRIPDNKLLKNGDVIILDDLNGVAPQLVSGSAESYLEIFKLLLETAKQHKNLNTPTNETYWTDALGLLQIKRESNDEAFWHGDLLLDGTRALKESDLTREDCNSKGYSQGRVAVHVGSQAILKGYVKPQLRLPKHRLEIAKQWLSEYYRLCGLQKFSFNGESEK